MVIAFLKSKIFFIFLLFFPFIIWGADTQINATMDEYKLVEQTPLKGSVTVTHSVQQAIDTNSFQLEGKPLKVEHLRDVKLSTNSPLTLSIYQFELPPKSKGLHLLPEISVVIAGKRYKTIPSTFEVTGANGTSNSNPAASPSTKEASASTNAAQTQPSKETRTTSETISEKPFLKLEAFVDGTTPIYPNQRLRFVYHYLFNGDIDLTKEVLPLLAAEGFRKVGDVQITDDVVNGHNVHEVAQTVEAIKPGTYSFPASSVEGLAYSEGEGGKKVYSPNKLQSETQPLEVVVAPFPEEGKPASFNGAIGQYILDVKMTTPRQITIGDKLELVIELTGNPQDIENVPLPDLCCQPGFSGLFKLSDLPPASKITGPAKQFVVEFRPLSTQIKEVPSIEFSSFDVTTQKYLTLRSEPIPLTVLPAKDGKTAIEAPLPKDSVETTAPITTPQPIEIQKPFSLSTSDLQNLLMASWWTLFFIPLGIFALYFQRYLKKEGLLSKQEVKTVTSQDIFDRALKENPSSSTFYDSLNKAFLLLLKEKGVISNDQVDPENLPQGGTAGQVREFLLRVEESRFSRKGELDAKLLQEARDLFKRLSTLSYTK